MLVVLFVSEKYYVHSELKIPFVRKAEAKSLNEEAKKSWRRGKKA